MLCHDLILWAQGMGSPPPTPCGWGSQPVRPPSRERTAETLNLFHQHLRNGDYELAARVLYFHADLLVNPRRQYRSGDAAGVVAYPPSPTPATTTTPSRGGCGSTTISTSWGWRKPIWELTRSLCASSTPTSTWTGARWTR